MAGVQTKTHRLDHAFGKRRHVAQTEIDALAGDGMDEMRRIAHQRETIGDEAARYVKTKLPGARRIEHVERAEMMAETALKLAQELNERSWFEGAMLKYLDVVSAFGLLKNPSVNASEIPALKAKIAEKSAVLNKSNFDHSIGITYLEIAQGILANEKISEADLKRVKVILDTVLSKYENKFK